MLQVKDRIKELTTTSGTGTLTLSGTAEAGFQAFSVLGNGTKTYYTISDVNGTDFEVGEGTYNSNTLTRDTIFESSNSGNAISLSATGSTVFVTYPAEKSSYRDIGVQRDYVASGSITAGKPLILNADNTVTQVAETSSTASTISSSNGDKFADVYNYTRDISVAYDTVNNKIGILYINNNRYPTIVIAEESNNALTYGTPVVVNSQTSYNSYQGQKLVYGNGVFVMCYSWEHYPIYLKAGVYSGTNSITLGSQIQPDTGTGFQSNATIGYNPNANKFVYTFPVANTSSINVYLITNSSTTLTTGNSATITMGYSSNNKVISNLYDPDTNKQVIMTDHLYGNEGRIYQATISGANITVPSTHYAITDDGSEEEGSKALSYDPDNNKWILFKANTGNVLRANVLTASGDTFTSGTVTQISSTYMRWLAPYYDTEKNKTVLSYRYNNGQPYYAGIGFVTISGTTPSFTASTTTLGNTTTTSSPSLYNQPHQAIYNPDTKSGIVVASFSTGNPSNGMGVVLYYETLTSSNLTTDNYFGIASSTASTTEPVGVNRAGSFNNDQTGMTAGKDMYVTDAGLIKERTTTTTTVGTVLTNTTQTLTDPNYSPNAPDISYDSVSDRYIKTYRGASDYPEYRIGAYNSSTKAVDWGTAQVIASFSTRGYNVFNSVGSSGAIGFVWTLRSGSSDYVKFSTSTINATTNVLTNSSLSSTSANVVTSSTEQYYPQGVVWDSGSSRFVIAWTTVQSSPAYTIYANCFEVNSNPNSDPIWSSSNQVTVDNTNGNDYGLTNNFSLIYDPDVQRTVHFFWTVDGSSNVRYGGRVLSISGSTITVGAKTTTGVAQKNSSNNNFITTYDTQNNKIICAFKENVGTYPKLYYQFVTVTGGSTNTISFSTGSQLTTFASQYYNIAFDTDNNKVVLLCDNGDESYYVYSNIYSSNGTSLTLDSSTLVSSTNEPKNAMDMGVEFVSGRGFVYNYAKDNVNWNMVNFSSFFGSTTSTVTNGSQFVGTARSGTDLELAEPPTELVAMANGSITKGKPVILRTDGDFAEVSGTTDSGAEINVLNNTTAIGSGTPASYDSISSASDGNGTTCFVYRRSSDQYGMAQLVTTDSTGAMTYGTLTSFFSTQTDCRHMGVSYDANYNDGAGGFYISLQRNAISRTYLVGLLFTGTTITYGDDGSWTSGSSTAEVFYNAYDSTNDKTYVWTSKPYSSMTAVTNHTGDYFQAGSINYPYGSASSRMQFGNMIYDNTNNRGTIFYRDESNSDYPTAMAYTVSGTTFTFGTATVLESSASFYINGAEGEADGNGTICVWNNGSNSALKSTVLSYSGTTITNGAIVTLNSTSVISGYQHLTYNKKSKQYLAVINMETSSDPKIPQIFVGTYSSGSITWGSKIALASLASNGNQLDFSGMVINETGNGAQNFIGAYTNWPAIYGGVYASAYSNTITNLTANNFIGFAENTVADNEDVKVKVISQSDENQTGLTTASQYYVQTDGTLSTTAGTPSVLGGTALSSTKILIKS